MLVAYSHANTDDELQIWVGLFGMSAAPGVPEFTINDEPVGPLRGDPPQLIHDGHGENYRGIYAFKPAGGGPYRVKVLAGGQEFRFSTDLLPREVPALLDGTFNILVCSCYYQPRDDRGLLGDIVSQIKVQPHLTLMAGDQIYGDLPLRGLRLPRQPDQIRADLGRRYRQNWASAALGTPGLTPVLTRAPVVCVPDDHEFWNNYPYKQAQIPDTLSDPSYDGWKLASNELYRDYQVSGASAKGAARLDVKPLKMLFLDMRCERDNDYARLMSADALHAFKAWVRDLLEDERSIGVLSSGQSLFIDTPNALEKHLADAEMPNYAQFEELQAQLGLLADRGIPVVYITGDVHWGRIARGNDLPSRGTMLYEVISSPSCLIDSPTDGLAAFKNTLLGRRAWPRHSDAAEVPAQFGLKGRFLLQALELSIIGDQVAMISFARTGGGVQFTVTYYGISRDKALSKSRSFGPYPLRPN